MKSIFTRATVTLGAAGITVILSGCSAAPDGENTSATEQAAKATRAIRAIASIYVTGSVALTPYSRLDIRRVRVRRPRLYVAASYLLPPWVSRLRCEALASWP